MRIDNKMIKKLRIKFIALSMLSLFAVLVIIIGTINILNYKNIVDEADNTLMLLKLNDGKFPIRNNKHQEQIEQQYPFDKIHPMSPELPYESRFFSVTFSKEGTVTSVDTENITAINDTEAIRLAINVLDSNKSKGFSGNYRYIVNKSNEEIHVIFLDCTRNLSTFKTFLFASCGISIIGLIAVFILMYFLSWRIIKPISDSYEKQKRFITDAGHELKTPITIIDADVEVLEMEISDNEWLQDIQKQTKRLTSLTNDLIYLSRMEEEKIKLCTIDFPISDLVSETAQSFQAVAKMQNKNFSLNIEPMLTINGDEKAINQLISILLDNALKYSPESGDINVILKKQGKAIILEVYNTTENISKNDLEHIFDRFYRADKSRNSQTGGYGIGLSIAKAVVTAHKGKITASSTDGNSLIITVSLPK